MNNDNLDIKIISQGWIEKSEFDLCSHGIFELTIGKENILNKSDNEWTISTSVLQLLRCIEPNSEIKKDFEAIMCCGGILMLGCPIGVYFDLEHKNEKIIINNIKKKITTGDINQVLYPNIKAEIDKKHFAIKILKVAREVKLFFKNSPKKNVTKMDKEFWIEFWKEFNELYENGIKKYNC